MGCQWKEDWDNVRSCKSWEIGRENWSLFGLLLDLKSSGWNCQCFFNFFRTVDTAKIWNPLLHVTCF